MRCQYKNEDGTICNEIIFSSEGGHNKKHGLNRLEFRKLLGIPPRKPVKKPEYLYIDTPNLRRRA